MKTILTYEFDDKDFEDHPDEYMFQKNEFKRITTSKEAYLCLFDIKEYIMEEFNKEYSEELDECIRKMSNRFYEILEDNRISLDDLE